MPWHQCAAVCRGAANARKIISDPVGISGHGRTYRWLDPVVNDPQRTFTTGRDHWRKNSPEFVIDRIERESFSSS